MFEAIVNAPGMDVRTTSRTLRDAWTWLADQRLAHIKACAQDYWYPVPEDEPGVCLLRDCADADHEPDSFWGATPGHEGGHDPRIVYAVVRHREPV